jgi:hypothetical protein
MDELETVKIKNDRQESGYVIINKSDFDPKVQELYGSSLFVEPADEYAPARRGRKPKVQE